MKTSVQAPIRIERIPGTKLVRMISPFYFYSEVLGRAGCIPVGFIYDEESIPILKGSNPEAGAIHDYLCRTDSEPIVSQYVAAMVYREFIRYYNQIEPEPKNWFMEKLDDMYDFIKMRIKPDAVIIAQGYFHKLPVMASLEQVQEVLGT